MLSAQSGCPDRPDTRPVSPARLGGGALGKMRQIRTSGLMRGEGRKGPEGGSYRQSLA